jgi:hypothetical protein
MNRKQTRAFFGPTSKAYGDFMKSQSLPPVVEDIGEDARLYWMGPKKAERVLLYLHGQQCPLVVITQRSLRLTSCRWCVCVWDSCIFSGTLVVYPGKSGEEREAYKHGDFGLL